MSNKEHQQLERTQGLFFCKVLTLNGLFACKLFEFHLNISWYDNSKILKNTKKKYAIFILSFELKITEIYVSAFFPVQAFGPKACRILHEGWALRYAWNDAGSKCQVSVYLFICLFVFTRNMHILSKKRRPKQYITFSVF